MKQTLIVIILFFTLCLQAQDSIAVQKKQKVGLVLSGGGAKGLAHIGALKVIDSLGIKIDYVAGTSMGAIVGSLYASGYSGKQLDSIFKEVDFDAIINDNVPRAAKTFYERENAEKYAIILPFDKFKVTLPSALSRGQNTYNLLSKLTMHVNQIDDFSKLPIPFFCIATDIESGEAVMLDKGSLPLAIRASGAFPSLFQPVQIDGRLLIDGGVVNNFPIDELKDKGLDLIIGVDVQDGLSDRDALNSALSILLQISNFRTTKEMKNKAKLADVYIQPNIDGFTVVSFNEGEKIIKSGVDATLKNIEGLKTIAQNQNQKAREPLKVVQHDSLKINKIDIKGIDNYTFSYVLGKLKMKPNETISYKDFQKGLNNIVATNNFDDFNYDLKKSKNKAGYDLITRFQETDKTTFLKLGVHYDNLYKSAVLLNLTKKQFLLDNDVASLDVILGDNVRYNFDYFIDKGFYWSVGVKSRYNEFHKNVNAATLLNPEDLAVLGVNKIDAKVVDFTNQFYIQTLFRKDFALTLGAEHKWYKVYTETILQSSNRNDTKFEDSYYLSVFGKLQFDTYDNRYFPNEGVYFNGDVHLYLHSSDYNNNFSEFSIAKADLGYAFSFSDRFSTNILMQGGFKINPQSNQSLNFVLGGYGNDFINNFEPFYGYDYLSIPANSFVKSTITLDYELFKKHHAILAANYSNAENNLFDTGNWFSLPDYSGYAVGYSVETFLGPIEAKYTWSPELKDGYWFFNLGFWF
ncbi:patatin-like phospholipase family protein [Lacinutrix salivirga]